MSPTPMQINKVTASIAWSTLRSVNAIEMPKHKPIFDVLHTTPFGPGTELKKLISWFYSPDKKKCKCLTRIAKMNQWGPDKCEQRMDTIVRWLKHSARIHKVPFFEPAVKLLIKKAIKNSRSQLQPGQSHVSSMNNLRVASQLQSYPSHIAYVYLELHL
jgi:hypothetical protein